MISARPLRCRSVLAAVKSKLETMEGIVDCGAGLWSRVSAM